MRTGVVSRMLRRRRILAEHHDRSGVLIAVEGCDIAANERVADAIAERLAGDGWRTLLERGDGRPESSYSSLAEALRATAALSDRLTSRVDPELAAGAVVVFQDYLDALVVRFGALGGLDEERLLRVGMWVARGAWPDLTVLVDPGAAVASEPEVGAGSAGLAPGVAAADATGAKTHDNRPRMLDVVGDAEPEHGRHRSGGDNDAESVDPEQAYRERAASAPERYLRIAPLSDDGRPGGELPQEVLDRIASVLRVRSPVTSQDRMPAVAGP